MSTPAPQPRRVETADLAECAREPIHIPGLIQPHGLLLAISRTDRRITYASANAAPTFGADALLDRPFADALPPLAARFASELDKRVTPGHPHHAGSVDLMTPAGERHFDAVISRSGDHAILELEEAPAGSLASLDALYPLLRLFVERLHEASTVQALCDLTAQTVRRLTQFDRVLVYRFDEAWNGTVIAEQRNGALPSYLDLRFPASDIPAQARELYRRNRLRIISDSEDTPVPILSSHPAPLDLSDAVLRSVSPVHIAYMRNMGTRASMSISILREGRLWGLISCHNKTPKRVPLQVRNACDFLAQIFSQQLDARENTALAERRVERSLVQGRLLAAMAAEDQFIDVLVRHSSDLLLLANAQGAAIVNDSHCWRMGETPEAERIKMIFGWLSEHRTEDVFATDALSTLLPEAGEDADLASGVLAIPISKMHPAYILWFRPELVRTVQWGGNPNKPVERGEGATRLHPRRSFEIWKETVRGRALPWDRSEIEAAADLRNAILGIVLRRAEELAALAEELRRSNKELEAFSYSISHDLRAPFRHIVGFSELLKRQEAERLSEQGRHYIDTIIESALNAGALVDNLLNFSRMSRTALKPQPVDTKALVEAIRRSLDAEAGREIAWRIGDLPTVQADPILLRVVFENLMANAVKYTRPRNPATIEIGAYREGEEIVFFVRDNGVGFDMKYVDKLFGVFQRLHRLEEFEGIGIGLANVRRIIERHGGRAWAEGALDRGATFYVSLPDTKGAP